METVLFLTHWGLEIMNLQGSFLNLNDFSLNFGSPSTSFEACHVGFPANLPICQSTNLKKRATKGSVCVRAKEQHWKKFRIWVPHTLGRKKQLRLDTLVIANHVFSQKNW